MSASPSAWLSSGEFFTDSPENSSEWPWTDGPTDTTLRHYQFVTYEGYLASAVYLTLTGTIGFLGNVIAITVFLTEKEFRQKEHNSLVLNLAIADFSICVFAYPSSTISGYAGRWLLGDVGCTIYGFLCFTFSMVSMVTLCAVSVYRYIVICKPQYDLIAKFFSPPAYLLTHRRTMYVIPGIWLYALLFTIPPLVGVNRYTFEPLRSTPRSAEKKRRQMPLTNDLQLLGSTPRSAEKKRRQMPLTDGLQLIGSTPKRAEK
ncbi:OPN4 [Branchiostoma lanceolatum]|uniref:OPN4 protein n=1 Tax=Branchiostoma lanceolatum TaxID=7740 RepID=A0A8J9ZMU7_BRALA|nr:OPN4 [Branchiostoma lanceolatum]